MKTLTFTLSTLFLWLTLLQTSLAQQTPSTTSPAVEVSQARLLGTTQALRDKGARVIPMTHLKKAKRKANKPPNAPQKSTPSL